MQRIRVELKKTVDESYDIVIERGGFRRIVPDLRSLRYAEGWVVITDSRVPKVFVKEMCDALKREKMFLGKVMVTSGEQSKSMSQLSEVLSQMVELGANRKSGVIAFGGGVIGDLAGFAAAMYMRGIAFVQVPTTLLAMVDSSVGGKTGVDLPEGKNMVGAFWQPRKVYIDVELLRSLPVKQWRAGLGECVKYGAIKDRKLWDFFEEHVEVFQKAPKDFLLSELSLVEEMIRRCVEIKAEVVSRDEKESGLRSILNYGHTFGHVVELMSGYTVPHGEAVAVGMRMAGALANRLRWLSDAEQAKQNVLLDDLSLGKTKVKGLVKDFVGYMKKDKKSNAKELRVVLVDRIGCVKQMMGQYTVKVEEKVVMEVLKEGGFVDEKGGGQTTDERGETREPSSGFSWGSGLSGYESSGYGGSHGVDVPMGKGGYGESAYRVGGISGEQTPLSRRKSGHLPLAGESFFNEETDLQRRLREMRERRERMGQRGGGLGKGGFLPG